MAFRKLEQMVDAISIGDPKEKGKDGKTKGNVRSVTGFLKGMKVRLGRTATNKGSNLYLLADEKTKEKITVWGNASIDMSLTNSDVLDETNIGKLIMIEFIEMRKSKPGQSDQRYCEVSVDDNTTEGSLNYKLKKV
jgi:hypothetical protein